MSAEQRPIEEETFAPPHEATLLSIASMDFDGDAVIEDLERHPALRLRGAEIDFTSNIWDFRSPDSPPTNTYLRRAKFSGDEDDGPWKLFLLCSCMWRQGKTVTHVQRLNSARLAFKGSGGTNARWSQIRMSEYRSYVDSIASQSGGSVRGYLAVFLDYLTFRRSYFHVPVDPELEGEIRRDIALRQAYGTKVATPQIDDSYLRPLIRTCRSVLDDPAEDYSSKLCAAAILVVSQTGMRTSELLGLEVDKIGVSSLPGKEDIVYLEYRIFKGSRKDEGNPNFTEMNETALKGYRWLEENCRRREELGISTLIVYPRQRGRYAGQANLREGIRALILSHRDSVPCINTQDRYPSLQRTRVTRLLKSAPSRTGDSRLTDLDGSETFVYPKIHSFRVTVATQHYERGDDLHYIGKRLGHATEAMTAAYIQSDKRLNEANSDLVYRSYFRDGAEFIGPHGKEFQRIVDRFVETLPEHVKRDLDEVVAATSKKFPLRRKVGGVCVHCGWVKGCKKNDKTDQIYCAFGVCPNQCVLYFMTDECLNRVRSHMELVPLNVERGHSKGARNELRKAQNVIRDALVPELDSLEKQIEAHGRDGVLERFPELEEIVDNLPEVRKEVAGWLEMSV